MFIPVWQLCLLAVILVGLVGLAITQNTRIRCLRYCYQLLAYFTPEAQKAARLETDRQLMKDFGIKPVLQDIFENHPGR